MNNDRLLDRPGTCRDCGTTRYTVRQLTHLDGQEFRCYACFDIARYGPEYGIIPEDWKPTKG